MKICDRCHNEDASQCKATEQISFKSTDERFDLCKSCSEDVREFLSCNPSELKQAFPIVGTIQKWDGHIQEGG